MAAVWTFATLKTAIQGRLGDQSTAIDTALGADIIPLAETRLLRDLNFTLWDLVGTFAITISTATATMPTGALALRWVYYTSGTTRVFLEPRSLSYVYDYSADSSVTGTPLYFAPLDETMIQLAPIPSASVTATTQYMKRPTGLSASATTTWLGSNVGDCLLHACLIEASKYIVADERIVTWSNEYVALVIAAREEFKRLIRHDAFMPAPVASQGTPNG